jgi:hypothetical protein
LRAVWILGSFKKNEVKVKSNFIKPKFIPLTFIVMFTEKIQKSLHRTPPVKASIKLCRICANKMSKNPKNFQKVSKGFKKLFN